MLNVHSRSDSTEIAELVRIDTNTIKCVLTDRSYIESFLRLTLVQYFQECSGVVQKIGQIIFQWLLLLRYIPLFPERKWDNKNPPWVWGLDRKNQSQGSPFSITRLAEWWQLVIPTDGFFYPILTQIMDSFSCSPLFFFCFRNKLPEVYAI